MKMVAPSGPVYQAGTLAAHPIGMCAGLATLKKAEKQKVYQILKGRMDTFVEDLKVGFQDTDWDVTAYGSLFWLHLRGSETYRSPDQFLPEMGTRFQDLFRNCLKRGVYLAPSAFEVDFISLAHTEDILQESSAALIEAAREATS